MSWYNNLQRCWGWSSTPACCLIMTTLMLSCLSTVKSGDLYHPSEKPSAYDPGKSAAGSKTWARPRRLAWRHQAWRLIIWPLWVIWTSTALNFAWVWVQDPWESIRIHQIPQNPPETQLFSRCQTSTSQHHCARYEGDYAHGDKAGIGKLSWSDGSGAKAHVGIEELAVDDLATIFPMGNPLEMGNLWQPCVETLAFRISKSVGWFL